MKAIEILHCLTGAVTSRADGSVKINFVTPELLASQAGVLFLLHGKNVTVSIVPEDTIPDEVVRVDTERRVKSRGERLRAVHYLIWERQGKKGDFENWYSACFESILSDLKQQLD